MSIPLSTDNYYQNGHWWLWATGATELGSAAGSSTSPPVWQLARTVGEDVRPYDGMALTAAGAATNEAIKIAWLGDGLPAVTATRSFVGAPMQQYNQPVVLHQKYGLPAGTLAEWGLRGFYIDASGTVVEDTSAGFTDLGGIVLDNHTQGRCTKAFASLFADYDPLNGMSGKHDIIRGLAPRAMVYSYQLRPDPDPGTGEQFVDRTQILDFIKHAVDEGCKLIVFSQEYSPRGQADLPVYNAFFASVMDYISGNNPSKNNALFCGFYGGGITFDKRWTEARVGGGRDNLFGVKAKDGEQILEFPFDVGKKFRKNSLIASSFGPRDYDPLASDLSPWHRDKYANSPLAEKNLYRPSCDISEANVQVDLATGTVSTGFFANTNGGSEYGGNGFDISVPGGGRDMSLPIPNDHDDSGIFTFLPSGGFGYTNAGFNGTGQMTPGWCAAALALAMQAYAEAGNDIALLDGPTLRNWARHSVFKKNEIFPKHDRLLRASNSRDHLTRGFAYLLDPVDPSLPVVSGHGNWISLLLLDDDSFDMVREGFGDGALNVRGCISHALGDKQPDGDGNGTIVALDWVDEFAGATPNV